MRDYDNGAICSRENDPIDIYLGQKANVVGNDYHFIRPHFLSVDKGLVYLFCALDTSKSESSLQLFRLGLFFGVHMPRGYFKVPEFTLLSVIQLSEFVFSSCRTFLADEKSQLSFHPNEHTKWSGHS